MKRGLGMTALLGALSLAACSGLSSSPGWGLVVDFMLANPEVKDKTGVQGVSDAGRRLFASEYLTPKGGGMAALVAEALPETVRVTWREDTETGRHFTTGRVVADHVVKVRERIPQAVLDYARAQRGRALRLLFRIKDDGVWFGWDVEETVHHPAGGSGLVYSMRGGDVPCYDQPRASNARPNCTEGPLERAPWFNSKWIRGRGNVD